ncbi:hypothetical protein ACFV5G_25775 [Streptomyces sp. NPDC059766]|uniref:hypothetical protein n=1 Tax=Streptomyces sp. NPDC059766 TaxID=3346940 RepID=UPI0036598727
MENSPEVEGRPLRYGREIGLGDVERLNSFLKARIARLAAAERGSDERHAARSIMAASHQLVTTLEYALSSPDSARETDALTRMQIKVSWNALWALVFPYQWHDAYDLDRWRSVKHWDATQQSEFEQRLADAFGEERLRRERQGESTE